VLPRRVESAVQLPNRCEATLGDLLRFPDSASIVVRLFAEAHTALAAIKAGMRL
jgi:hypothetical protein